MTMTKKRVVYEPVKLAQEFRSFDFMSPWEGAEYMLPGDEKASDEAITGKRAHERYAETGPCASV